MAAVSGDVLPAVVAEAEALHCTPPGEAGELPSRGGGLVWSDPTERAASDPRSAAVRAAVARVRAGADPEVLRRVLDGLDGPGEVSAGAGYRLGPNGVGRGELEAVYQRQVGLWRAGLRVLRPRRAPVLLSREERNELVELNARPEHPPRFD